MAPNFGPSCGGPARPTALRTPTPTSGAWPPRRCLRHRVAPAGAQRPAAAKYRLNRARRGACGVVPPRHASSLVGVLRLRETH